MLQPAHAELVELAVLQAVEILTNDGVLVGVREPLDAGVAPVAGDRADRVGEEPAALAEVGGLVQVAHDDVGADGRVRAVVLDAARHGDRTGTGRGVRVVSDAQPVGVSGGGCEDDSGAQAAGVVDAGDRLAAIARGAVVGTEHGVVGREAAGRDFDRGGRGRRPGEPDIVDHHGSARAVGVGGGVGRCGGVVVEEGPVAGDELGVLAVIVRRRAAGVDDEAACAAGSVGESDDAQGVDLARDGAALNH